MQKVKKPSFEERLARKIFHNQEPPDVDELIKQSNMLLGHRSPSLVELSEKKLMASDMEDVLQRRAKKISIQR